MADEENASPTMKDKLKKGASNFGSAMLTLVIGCSVLTVAAAMLNKTLVTDWSGEAIAIKIALLLVAFAFVVSPLYMLLSPPMKSRHYARSSLASAKRMRKVNTKSLKSGMASVLSIASGFDKVYDD